MFAFIVEIRDKSFHFYYYCIHLFHISALLVCVKMRQSFVFKANQPEIGSSSYIWYWGGSNQYRVLGGQTF